MAAGITSAIGRLWQNPSVRAGAAGAIAGTIADWFNLGGENPIGTAPSTDIVGTQGGAMVPGTVGGAPSMNCGGSVYARWDRPSGQWVVYRRRRRRRRMVTTSDIKDIMAMKSILGGGKAFETWLATAGRSR